MPLYNFIGFIIETIDRLLVPLIFAVAFLVFLIGVFQYFIAGGADDEKRKLGRSFVLYGLIGFFIMISLWGIVNVLVGTFGFGSQARPPLPAFGPANYGGGVIVANGTGGANTAQPGTCFLGNICLPSNECAGGICIPRSEEGTLGGGCGSGCGPGLTCQENENVCISAADQ